MLNIQDTDPGFHSLITSLRSLEDKKLKVGVLPSAGRNSEGVDLVDVAVWNEFGTRHIPARPFMRIAADKNENKWNRYAERCVDGIEESCKHQQCGLPLGRADQERCAARLWFGRTCAKQGLDDSPQGVVGAAHRPWRLEAQYRIQD